MASINYYAGISMNGSNIEMNKNQLLQPVIETGTGLPTTGNSVVGQMFYDNTTNLMYFFNGTAWIEMDGSGSGVSSLTIANAGVNAGGIDTSLVIDATTSANTLQPMQFGGSANIGMVPDASGGTDSGKFLKGDGTWETPVGAYTSWKLQASTGTEFSVVDGATVSFAVSSGSGITTAVSNPTGIVGLLQISMDVSSLTTAVPLATDFIAFSDESETDDPTRKVTIANLLSLAPQGDITKVTPSIENDELGIVIVNPDGPIPEVGFSVVALAAASAVASTDQLLLVSGTGQNSTNKKVSVSDLVAAGDTTYALESTTAAANFVAIKLDASSGAAGDSNVNFKQASDNNVTLTRIANGDIELGFSNNIDIGGTLEVANSSTFIGAVTMEDFLNMEASIFMDDNKITSLADGTSSGDAVNLGQVQSLVAGVGIFRGGYDASTGLTTDLSPNGAINGASNIATDLGDFYAVTVSGTQLGLTLEPGDLIFANVAIAASSSPANSAFTVVQSGQSVATAAATDNGAVKGIAGFDSATFTVSGTGWVQSVVYSGTSNIGVVPSGGDATKFLRGDGTWVVPTNSGGTITSVVQSGADSLLGISVNTIGTEATVGLNINGLAALGAAPSTGDTLPIFDLTASPSINRKVTVQNLTNAHQRDTTFSGTLSAYGSITHGLGSFDVIVQLYDETSFKTIYMDIERDSVNTVVLSGSGTFPGDVKVLVTKIG